MINSLFILGFDFALNVAFVRRHRFLLDVQVLGNILRVQPRHPHFQNA